MTVPKCLKQFAYFFGLVTLAPAASILIVTDDNDQTQSLADDLIANGHTFTRGAYTSGIPSAAELASIELIIVARETTSTQYDEGSEPADWNGIAKPLINMAPHLMRSSRWGYVNGSTLPSISPFTSYDSPFLEPTHPIVSGLSTNVLNPSFAGTGISNPLPAAAISIATVGTSHGIFIIPEGTPMFNNRGTAGAVRIGFIRGDSTAWDNASINGNKILENMINWSLAISVGPPTVANSPASDIAAVSATLNGEITNTGGSTPNVILYYGDNNAGTNAAAWDHSIDLGAQASAFSTPIMGLSPSTTYFFRSFATNLAGDDWAPNTSSFTTSPPANTPTIVNNPASGIGFTRADLNGTVTNTGGEDPLITIYHGDNDGGTNPANWDGSINLPAQSGSFTASLESLSANSTYYYRAFAQNSGGNVWAPSSQAFTTNAFALASLTNSPATAITGNSASIPGEVTATGGDAPTVTIHYGPVDGGTNSANWANSTSIGAHSSNFTAILTDLIPLTTYHFRALAQNGAGASWAPSSLSFTTQEASDFIINEFMAANDGGQSNNPNNWYPIANQITGTSDDWIEIFNTTTSPLSLDGWALSDNPLDLTKWTFPANTEIPAGGFLILYASGDGVPDANGNLHTNFRLSSAGENLSLIRR